MDLKSHLPASIYNPCIRTPSSGTYSLCSISISSWSSKTFLAMKSNFKWSIGILYFLAHVCNMPVKNPWGKEKPEIQKEIGFTSINQIFLLEWNQFLAPNF